MLPPPYTDYSGGAGGSSGAGPSTSSFPTSHPAHPGSAAGGGSRPLPRPSPLLYGSPLSAGGAAASTSTLTAAAATGGGGGAFAGGGGGSTGSRTSPMCPLDPVSLRFRDAGLEAAYLSHQGYRLAGVDRAAVLTTGALVVMAWLMRGDREACFGVQALTTLAYMGHVLALLVMQDGDQQHQPTANHLDSHNHLNHHSPVTVAPPPPHRRRVVYIAAVRLAYAAAYAAFNPLCRREDVLACGGAAAGSRLRGGGGAAAGPTFGRVFLTDSALVLLLFQAIALPLPYRVHMCVSAAVLGMLLALHNGEVCGDLCGSCHAAWFFSALQSHHRLARGLLLAGRALTSRPLPDFGATHACWCSLLFAQVVAGFLLPGGFIYLMEEAARRRYLAGWTRRAAQAQAAAERRQQQEAAERRQQQEAEAAAAAASVLR